MPRTSGLGAFQNLAFATDHQEKMPNHGVPALKTIATPPRPIGVPDESQRSKLDSRTQISTLPSGEKPEPMADNVATLACVALFQILTLPAAFQLNYRPAVFMECLAQTIIVFLAPGPAAQFIAFLKFMNCVRKVL